ncbi:MAG: hypothetical protein ACD_45C00578G0002 [uncultured bacterium]|nr:MAG: hypothetical protein ACD_45C00578G0002 [uncultured bacterium]
MTTIIRLGARIRAARKAAGFKTAKTFLKKHKVPASTYSQHESGARTPDDKALKFYSKVFDVGFDWLKNGKGHPYKKTDPAKKAIFAEESFEIKQINNKNLDIKLLTDIIEQLFKEAKIFHASKSAKGIANKVAKMYSKNT